MDKETNISHGLKWGVIIGVVYCILLLLRYNQGQTNAMMFGIWAFLGYIIVLILLFICGVTRRSNLGGYIHLKEAAQTMFMAVIGFEFFYMAFNFIYLKYINPEFFVRLKNAMEIFMEKNNIDQSSIEDRLKEFDKMDVTKMNLGTFFLQFANGIVGSGVFALIFALIIRRKDPLNPETKTI